MTQEKDGLGNAWGKQVWEAVNGADVVYIWGGERSKTYTMPIPD